VLISRHYSQITKGTVVRFWDYGVRFAKRTGPRLISRNEAKPGRRGPGPGSTKRTRSYHLETILPTEMELAGYAFSRNEATVPADGICKNEAMVSSGLPAKRLRADVLCEDAFLFQASATRWTGIAGLDGMPRHTRGRNVGVGIPSDRDERSMRCFRIPNYQRFLLPPKSRCRPPPAPPPPEVRSRRSGGRASFTTKARPIKARPLQA
jgi:hypothetical protein